MFDVILNQYLSDPNLIYWTVLITIFVNGIINTPSSQVIYLGAGYLASVNNNVSLILLVIVGGIANAVSNLILHLLIRKYHIKATDYIGKFFKLNQDDIEYYKSVAKEKGAIWLIMSKTIPGIKVYTPLITGLINMKNLLSFVIFLIGSIIWAAIFVLVGYYFGKTFDITQFLIIVTILYLAVSFFIVTRLKKQRILYKMNNIK